MSNEQVIPMQEEKVNTSVSDDEIVESIDEESYESKVTNPPRKKKTRKQNKRLLMKKTLKNFYRVMLDHWGGR